MTMDMTSPQNNPLVVLEGTHTDIHGRGEQLVTLGLQMARTARSLKKISEGETQISEAVDTLRESAEGVHADLDKAGTRYEDTGRVLRTYATALETAQLRLTPLVEQIEEKAAAAQTALAEQQEAQRTSSDLDTTWIWEEEPTDQEVTAAATALSEAGSSARAAQGELTALWETYDLHFGTWSDAYDAAVTGIGDAINAADNNDSWFDDALDFFIEAIGYIAMALVIAALFVAAPLAAIFLIAAAIITVVSLIAHIYLLFKGRATATDIIFDVIGLIPFVKPIAGILRTGGGAARIGSGLYGMFRSPGAVQAIGTARSKVEHFALHGVRGDAAQTAIRESLDSLIKPGTNYASQAWSRILGGDPATGDLIRLTNHVRNSVVDTVPRMSSWVTGAATQSVIPATTQMGANVGSFVLGFDQAAQDIIPAWGAFRETY